MNRAIVTSFCYYALVGGPDGFLCRIWNSLGPSVQDWFQTHPETYALGWTPHTPLHVFFNPAFIGLNAEGKNLGNEALIFHEALHGLTGLYDVQLLQRLALPSPSCNIEKLIQQHVLAVAPGLNSQVAFN